MMPSGLQLVREQWDDVPIPEAIQRFLREAQTRIDGGDWPECFVPSDYAAVYQALAQIEPPPRRVLEWGCGLGVVAGLAAMLGWEAEGVEQSRILAGEARALMSDFGLQAAIHCADLFSWPFDAELVYMYMWPKDMPRCLEHFARQAPARCRLLYFDGGTTLTLVAAASS